MSYPITDDERNKLLSHSHITVALASAAAQAENEDQIKGVALAVWRIAGEINHASWGFDSKAFVAEVERMAQAELDRKASMTSLARMLNRAAAADAEADECDECGAIISGDHAVHCSLNPQNEVKA